MKKIVKLFNALTEVPRGIVEWGSLQAMWRTIKEKTPEGDGHPVLILPGFMTTDTYTSPLRNCLAEKGYKIYTWDGGLNTGLDDKKAQHLHEHIEKIFAENGNRKISIIGHSLGGVYARELAREYPDMVRAVVTLGTPFGLDVKKEAAPEALRKLYDFFNSNREEMEKILEERGLTPPPVPTTSIYSKTDGIVDWDASINPASSETENIEVSSSHLGMIVNPPAVVALLDRLAQKEGDWKPFDQEAYSKDKFFSYGEGPKAEDIPANPGWKPVKQQSKPLFRKNK